MSKDRIRSHQQLLLNQEKRRSLNQNESIPESDDYELIPILKPNDPQFMKHKVTGELISLQKYERL